MLTRLPVRKYVYKWYSKANGIRRGYRSAVNLLQVSGSIHSLDTTTTSTAAAAAAAAAGGGGSGAVHVAVDAAKALRSSLILCTLTRASV
jgi:RecA/RadA recombinase